MFLVAHGRIFLQVIIFKAPLLMLLTQVLTKELVRILIHVRKIFNSIILQNFYKKHFL